MIPFRNFNPRAPRGARLATIIAKTAIAGFQSTRSARSATFLCFWGIKQFRNFNPRAPRGARPSCTPGHLPRYSDFNPRAPRGARRRLCDGFRIGEVISIHALREERDPRCGAVPVRGVLFQSTRSARSATHILQCSVVVFLISIHALREERDAIPVW